MHNFKSYLLWALAVCSLCHGSWTEDPQSAYVCLLDDPDTNQEETNCRTEIQDSAGFQEVKNKLQGVEAKLKGHLQGVEAKLKGQLQEVQTQLKGQLQGVEAKLKGRLQKVEAKLEDQRTALTKVEAKLEEILLAVQTRLGDQHPAVLKEAENNLQSVSNTTDAAKVEITPPGFERVGTRYFRVVHEYANWDTANRKCREMGGYLASFQNEGELNAVAKKCRRMLYWLGINDQMTGGQFVSVASGKPAQFLKWGEGEPSDVDHRGHCVTIIDSDTENTIIMKMFYCTISLYFICQADNEI